MIILRGVGGDERFLSTSERRALGAGVVGLLLLVGAGGWAVHEKSLTTSDLVAWAALYVALASIMKGYLDHHRAWNRERRREATAREERALLVRIVEGERVRIENRSPDREVQFIYYVDWCIEDPSRHDAAQMKV